VIGIDIGGLVVLTMLIDATNEFFALLRRSRINVAEKALKREDALPNEIRRIFNRSSVYFISFYVG